MRYRLFQALNDPQDPWLQSNPKIKVVDLPTQID
jgi:hypothetical protein